MQLPNHPAVTAVAILGFVASNAGAALLFKYVAQSQGRSLVGLFILANAVGFLCTLCLPLALRDRNPNLIYACCFGGSFCVLQLASWLLFRHPLSPAQWAGMACVTAGILLLQLGR